MRSFYLSLAFFFFLIHPLLAATGPSVNGEPFNAVTTPYTLTLSSNYVYNGQWVVDWGDGQNTYPTTSTTVTHQYNTKGAYQIKVSLFNQKGKQIFIAPNYPQQIYSQEPILYYGFNNESNVGPDYVPNGAPKTITSVKGLLGKAIMLANNAYLRVPNTFVHHANFFGLEFWFKPLDLINTQMIYASVGNTPGNVKVYIENNRLYFTLVGLGTKSIDLSSIMSKNTWHHAAISYESSAYDFNNNAMRIYLDGWLRLDSNFDPTITPPIAINYQGATIGAYDDGHQVSQFYTGNLDEIAIFPLGIFPGAYLKRNLDVTKVSLDANLRVGIGPLGAETFTVEKPQIQREVLVPLDPDPMVDNLPNIQIPLSNATPGTRLKFVDKYTGLGGGTYYIRSHNGNNWRIFMLANVNNIEIDGNNTTLLKTSAVTYFILKEGTHHIYIHDLTLALDPASQRPGVYAKILKITPASQQVVVQFVKGKNLEPDVIPLQSNLWRWRSIDAITRKDLIGIDSGMGPITRVVNPTDPSIWTLTLQRSPTNNVWAKLAAAQQPNRILQINNYLDGDHQFLMSDVKHIIFDHVNMTGCMSMVFLASNFDYLQVSNSKVGLPDGLSILDAPFASCSDGFHFSNAKGGHLIFQNNDIALTDDDPIAMKDNIYDVVKLSNFQLTADGIDNGSEIELRTMNFEELIPPFVANVTAIDVVNHTITLDKEIPGSVNDSFHALVHNHQTRNWIYRNNVFHDLYGRMMIYTNDGTMLNNRFQKTYFHIGLSNTSFDGGNFPSNIIFKNNQFITADADISQWGTILPKQPIIPDIGFYNNSMREVSWRINRAKNLIMLDNYFEKINSIGLVQLNNYSQAQIFGNWHYNPITTLWISADSTSTFAASDNNIQNSLLQTE